jgi:predicted permease
MTSLILDLRFAFRTLRRRLLYAAVAVLTLGLGIGAATTMFSVIEGVMLSPLPYEEPGRLLSVWMTIPKWKDVQGSGQNWSHVNLTDLQYRDWRENTELFQDVAMFHASEWGYGTLTGSDRPERVSMGVATASLLPVLGVRPDLGRWFEPAEEGAAAGQAAPVAVLSHRAWQRRFGGDREIIGRTIGLEGIERTIIGVLPADFRLRWLTASPTGTGPIEGKEIWLPYGQPWDCFGCGSSMYQAVGRLTPGVTLEQALAETRAILTRPDLPDAGLEERDVRLVPRDEDERRGLGTPLFLLQGATGQLLLIACGNIATLSLGEAHRRRQELTIRSALGASRPRIARQLLTESVVVGLLGSLVGVILAAAGTRALVLLAPPIPRIDTIAVDFPVLLFAAGTGILSGLLFGITPSVAAGSAGASLRAGERGATVGSRWFHRIVLACEIALTVVLLVATGLLIRSLSKLTSVDPGFDSDRLATLQLSLPDSRFAEPESHVAFLREVLRAIEVLPGVRAASAGNDLPFPGRTSGWGVWLGSGDDGSREMFSARLYHIAPGYHELLGIPLIEGRTFRATDGPDASRVAVVGASLARKLWPDRSPVGERLHYPWAEVTVVGVVADAHRAALDTPPELTFYVPFVQHSSSTIGFAARTHGDPGQLIQSLREAVWTVDPEVAITRAGTMRSLIANSTREEQYRSFLLTVFGFLAAVLTAVGVFGVVAQGIARRTREFGIRMVLGAKGHILIAGVLGGSLATALAGTALGLVAAFWASRLVARFLFGVHSADALTYGVTGALVVAICALAAYLAARRIARVDPATVLHTE